MPAFRQKTWHIGCDVSDKGERYMTHALSFRTLLGFAEHAAFVIIGFVFMVIGLALGVTMIMLPVGLVVGLAGFAMFVGGLFVRNLDRS
jgi:hypothetical protein